MDLIFGILWGVLVLTVLVALHELGHGIVARRNGVKVEEFGIGFPPKAKGKKIPKSILGKNVEYTLNWLPLGGFVRLKGEYDGADEKGTYGATSFWTKTKILLAGVFVNWVTAAVLFTILALVGIPKIVPDQFSLPSDTVIQSKPVEIASVVADLPAAKAGLQVGDRIVRFNGQKAETTEELTQMVKDSAGKSVPVIYTRDSKESTAMVDIRSNNEDQKGYLGAALGQQQLIKATWSAPIVGVGTTAQLTWATIQGLGDTIAKAVTGLVGQLNPDPAGRKEANANLAAAGNAVAGPVGIFGVIFPAAEKAGFLHIVLLTAIISLTLAVINILPIPGLDGGRWFLTAAFKLMKKPLTEELEAKINGIGMLVLLGLFVLVTIADINKIVG